MTYPPRDTYWRIACTITECITSSSPSSWVALLIFCLAATWTLQHSNRNLLVLPVLNSSLASLFQISPPALSSRGSEEMRARRRQGSGKLAWLVPESSSSWRTENRLLLFLQKSWSWAGANIHQERHNSCMQTLHCRALSSFSLESCQQLVWRRRGQ